MAIRPFWHVLHQTYLWRTLSLAASHQGLGKGESTDWVEEDVLSGFVASNCERTSNDLDVE
jgi:hypothetical protein